MLEYKEKKFETKGRGFKCLKIMNELEVRQFADDPSVQRLILRVRQGKHKKN